MGDEGLPDSNRRKAPPSAHAVQAYVNALPESWFFYEARCFDIRSKAWLRTPGKDDIADISLRNCLPGFCNSCRGQAAGHVVCYDGIRSLSLTDWLPGKKALQAASSAKAPASLLAQEQTHGTALISASGGSSEPIFAAYPGLPLFSPATSVPHIF